MKQYLLRNRSSAHRTFGGTTLRMTMITDSVSHTESAITDYRKLGPKVRHHLSRRTQPFGYTVTW